MRVLISLLREEGPMLSSVKWIGNIGKWKSRGIRFFRDIDASFFFWYAEAASPPGVTIIGYDELIDQISIWGKGLDAENS